jgi:hypothetical protein
VGEGLTRTINASFSGVHDFLCTQSRIVCICTFLAFLAYACARASCIVSAHVNFITSCIVCALWKCIFGAMNELIGVWRCWIPVTICGKNFSDNTRNTIPYHTKARHTIPYHTISWIGMDWKGIPYHTKARHTIPYHTIQMVRLSGGTTWD